MVEKAGNVHSFWNLWKIFHHLKYSTTHPSTPPHYFILICRAICLSLSFQSILSQPSCHCWDPSHLQGPNQIHSLDNQIHDFTERIPLMPRLRALWGHLIEFSCIVGSFMAFPLRKCFWCGLWSFSLPTLLLHWNALNCACTKIQWYQAVGHGWSTSHCTNSLSCTFL